MTAKSELWRETLFFHENVILESGIQPLDAAGTALSQGAASTAGPVLALAVVEFLQRMVFHTQVWKGNWITPGQ